MRRIFGASSAGTGGGGGGASAMAASNSPRERTCTAMMDDNNRGNSHHHHRSNHRSNSNSRNTNSSPMIPLLQSSSGCNNNIGYHVFKNRRIHYTTTGINNNSSISTAASTKLLSRRPDRRYSLGSAPILLSYSGGLSRSHDRHKSKPSSSAAGDAGRKSVGSNHGLQLSPPPPPSEGGRFVQLNDSSELSNNGSNNILEVSKDGRKRGNGKFLPAVAAGTPPRHPRALIFLRPPPQKGHLPLMDSEHRHTTTLTMSGMGDNGSVTGSMTEDRCDSVMQASLGVCPGTEDGSCAQFSVSAAAAARASSSTTSRNAQDAESGSLWGYDDGEVYIDAYDDVVSQEPRHPSSGTGMIMMMHSLEQPPPPPPTAADPPASPQQPSPRPGTPVVDTPDTPATKSARAESMLTPLRHLFGAGGATAATATSSDHGTTSTKNYSAPVVTETVKPSPLRGVTTAATLTASTPTTATTTTTMTSPFPTAAASSSPPSSSSSSLSPPPPPPPPLIYDDDEDTSLVAIHNETQEVESMQETVVANEDPQATSSLMESVAVASTTSQQMITNHAPDISVKGQQQQQLHSATILLTNQVDANASSMEGQPDRAQINEVQEEVHDVLYEDEEDELETDFYRNPTILSRLILNQKYDAAIRRLHKEPHEARIWLVAKRWSRDGPPPTNPRHTRPTPGDQAMQQQQQHQGRMDSPVDAPIEAPNNNNATTTLASDHIKRQPESPSKHTGSGGYSFFFRNKKSIQRGHSGNSKATHKSRGDKKGNTTIESHQETSTTDDRPNCNATTVPGYLADTSRDRNSNVKAMVNPESGDHLVYSIRQLPLHMACMNLSRTYDAHMKDLLHDLICRLLVTYPESAALPDHQGKIPIREAIWHGAEPDTISMFLMASPDVLSESTATTATLSTPTNKNGNVLLSLQDKSLLELNQYRSTGDISEKQQVHQLLILGVDFWARARQEAAHRLKHNRQHPDRRRRLQRQQQQQQRQEREDELLLQQGSNQEKNPAKDTDECDNDSDNDTTPATNDAGINNKNNGGCFVATMTTAGSDDDEEDDDDDEDPVLAFTTDLSLGSQSVLASSRVDEETIYSYGEEMSKIERMELSAANDADDEKNSAEKEKESVDRAMPRTTGSEVVSHLNSTGSKQRACTPAVDAIAWNQLEQRATALEQILVQMNEQNYELNKKIDGITQRKDELLDQLEELRESDITQEVNILQYENAELNKKLSTVQNIISSSIAVDDESSMGPYSLGDALSVASSSRRSSLGAGSSVATMARRHDEVLKLNERLVARYRTMHDKHKRQQKRIERLRLLVRAVLNLSAHGDSFGASSSGMISQLTSSDASAWTAFRYGLSDSSTNQGAYHETDEDDELEDESMDDMQWIAQAAIQSALAEKQKRGGSSTTGSKISRNDAAGEAALLQHAQNGAEHLNQVLNSLVVAEEIKSKSVAHLVGECKEDYSQGGMGDTDLDDDGDDSNNEDDDEYESSDTSSYWRASDNLSFIFRMAASKQADKDGMVSTDGDSAASTAAKTFHSSTTVVTKDLEIPALLQEIGGEGSSKQGYSPSVFSNNASYSGLLKTGGGEYSTSDDGADVK